MRPNGTPYEVPVPETPHVLSEGEAPQGMERDYVVYDDAGTERIRIGRDERVMLDEAADIPNDVLERFACTIAANANDEQQSFDSEALREAVVHMNRNIQERAERPEHSHFVGVDMGAMASPSRRQRRNRAEEYHNRISDGSGRCEDDIRSYEIPFEKLHERVHEVVRDYIYPRRANVDPYDIERILRDVFADIYIQGLKAAQRTVPNPKMQADAIVQAYEEKMALRNFVIEFIDDRLDQVIPDDEREAVIENIKRI